VEEGQQVEQRAAGVGGVPVPAGFPSGMPAPVALALLQSEPPAEEDTDLRGIDRDVAAGRDVLFGRAQNRRYPSHASRTAMAMQKQQMNVFVFFL
jgi:predicted component of type VI protein secretion system